MSRGEELIHGHLGAVRRALLANSKVSDVAAKVIAAYWGHFIIARDLSSESQGARDPMREGRFYPLAFKVAVFVFLALFSVVIRVC